MSTLDFPARKPHPLGAATAVTSIDCIVSSGRGICATERAGDVKAISERLGMHLQPGSLNLVTKRPIYLAGSEAVYWDGTYNRYWKGWLCGLPVLINRWQSCPAHVFEIFAEVRLRDAFDLFDGEAVPLHIDAQAVAQDRSNSATNRMVWTVLWKWRERRFFSDDRYAWLLTRSAFRKYAWRSLQI
jgi:hypothetical protein